MASFPDPTPIHVTGTGRRPHFPPLRTFALHIRLPPQSVSVLGQHPSFAAISLLHPTHPPAPGLQNFRSCSASIRTMLDRLIRMPS